MSELKAGKGTLTAVVQVKRAATGNVDEFTIVMTPAEPEQEQKEASDGGDTQRDPA